MISFFRCTAETDHDEASATVPVKVIVNGPVIVSNSGDQVGLKQYFFLYVFLLIKQKVGDEIVVMTVYFLK